MGHAALFFLIPVVMSALRLYILAQLCADFAGLRGFVQICLSLLPGWRDSIAPALFGLPFAARRLRGALLALAAAVRVVRHAEGRRLGTAFGILRLFIPIPAAFAGEVTAQSKSGRIIPAFGVHRHGDQPSAAVLSAPQRTERFLRRLGGRPASETSAKGFFRAGDRAGIPQHAGFDGLCDYTTLPSVSAGRPRPGIVPSPPQSAAAGRRKKELAGKGSEKGKSRREAVVKPGFPPASCISGIRREREGTRGDKRGRTRPAFSRVPPGCRLFPPFRPSAGGGAGRGDCPEDGEQAPNRSTEAPHRRSGRGGWGTGGQGDGRRHNQGFDVPPRIAGKRE